MDVVEMVCLDRWMGDEEVGEGSVIWEGECEGRGAGFVGEGGEGGGGWGGE